MVTGPGRTVLFYGRHSLGEGLSPDKSRDATFELTGVATWVGKPAYLAKDLLTIQEGDWQEIAQAITESQIKARGPGHPFVNLLTPQPFRFDQWGDSPQRDIPRDANSDHKLSLCQPSRGHNCNRCKETKDTYHLNPHCHPQTMGLKATGVGCRQPHQCHHCQTSQKAPNIPREVDDVGKPEPTWKLIYPSSKMRMQRM